MKWFTGGIPQAIQAAKQNNSVFIVYVAGEDAKSTEMESRLNSSEVSAACEENRCVAIKIMGSSDECKFFSQIYPVVVIPSTFFIGHTGVPLEVIGEVTTPEEFLAKVNKAIELQKTKSGPAKAPSPPQAESSPEEPSQAQEEGDIGATAMPSAEEGPSTAQIAEASGSGDEITSPEKKAKVDEDLDTRVERAKQMVETKREEKQQKEADDERRKELERRSTGQGVQKLRQQQKERELLESKMELKKDREEEKLARQRVKEQIARDRAERAARFNQEKEDRDHAKEEARKRKLQEQQAVQQEELARRSEIARLQFRKPDGSSVTQQFPATATFAEVHSFITQEMGTTMTLSTTFPRRTFTSEDHSLTLQQLQLVPSAAILVMPGGMSTGGVRASTDRSLGLTSLAGFILAPIVFVWNMIASLLGLSGSPRPSSSQPSGSSGTAPTASGGERNQGGAVRRSAGSRSTQQGAIHRFHNTQDDEDPDDNSTWNGNSTQQM